MSPLAFAVDRVDRIEPRVQEQPERRRRATPPFPGHDKDKDEDRREPTEPPIAPRSDDDDDEKHLIDLLVRGRLPTRQILPGSARAALPS